MLGKLSGAYVGHVVNAKRTRRKVQGPTFLPGGFGAEVHMATGAIPVSWHRLGIKGDLQ